MVSDIPTDIEVNSPSSQVHKPRRNQFTDSRLRHAVSVNLSDSLVEQTSVKSVLKIDTSAVFLRHSDGDNFEADIIGAVSVIRQFEKETKRPIFVVLSLTHVSSKAAFLNVCKIVYINGLDGILIKTPDDDETLKYIRNEALGMRGRRVKILADDVSMKSLAEVDGVLVSKQVSSQEIESLLYLQKLLFTFDIALTHKVDMLVSPCSDSSTPPTTVPSTPIVSLEKAPLKSLLLNEVEKFLTTSTRLIVALSDDGQSVGELSFQSRCLDKRLPTILGLSAAESVCRYMGCLYGVVSLQTPSFISVPSVIANALDWAKNQGGLVDAGDHVVVILQPPSVTASTSASCFEGIVQSKYVE